MTGEPGERGSHLQSREPGSSAQQVSAAVRADTIDLLSEHFAQDHLTLDDFERRVTQAHAAKTTEALAVLLRDLPAGNVPARVDGGPGTSLQGRVSASVPAGRVRERDQVFSIFSETKRQGRWIPARETQAVSVFGSTLIDLREALLGPGETVIKCYSILGSIEVIAPEGLYVESGGSAFLGSFEQEQNSPVSMQPDAPVVRIEGHAVLGSVEVQFREPGESKRDARRRKRREKRERKRLGAG